jgi:hypothetical protein
LWNILTILIAIYQKLQDIHVKLNPGLSWRKKLSKRRKFFTHKVYLNSTKKFLKCYIWSIAVHGAVSWTLRKVEHKYRVNFKMWYWRRMEKTSCIDRVRDERVKEERNTPKTVKGRKTK